MLLLYVERFRWNYGYFGRPRRCLWRSGKYVSSLLWGCHEHNPLQRLFNDIVPERDSCLCGVHSSYSIVGLSEENIYFMEENPGINVPYGIGCIFGEA